MLVPVPPFARRTSAIVNESGSTWTSVVAVVIVMVTGRSSWAERDVPPRLRPYGRHFCSPIREEFRAGWPFSQLAICPHDDEPAARTARPGVEMAVFDPSRGTSDDPRGGGDRRSARQVPRRERQLGMVR